MPRKCSAGCRGWWREIARITRRICRSHRTASARARPLGTRPEVDRRWHPRLTPDGQGQAATFSLDTADRIEVLRGPAATQHGSNAGGVIQMFSRDGEGAPRVGAETLVGSDGPSKNYLTARTRSMASTPAGRIAQAHGVCGSRNAVSVLIRALQFNTHRLLRRISDNRSGELEKSRELLRRGNICWLRPSASWYGGSGAEIDVALPNKS